MLKKKGLEIIKQLSVRISVSQYLQVRGFRIKGRFKYFVNTGFAYIFWCFIDAVWKQRKLPVMQVG